MWLEPGVGVIGDSQAWPGWDPLLPWTAPSLQCSSPNPAGYWSWHSEGKRTTGSWGEREGNRWNKWTLFYQTSDGLGAACRWCKLSSSELLCALPFKVSKDYDILTFMQLLFFYYQSTYLDFLVIYSLLPSVNTAVLSQAWPSFLRTIDWVTKMSFSTKVLPCSDFWNQILTSAMQARSI